ncbi:hypothetical protein, partial [Streptococcus mutans]|uniref:hypothetical protein n=1 Tax=Streptococcus mutans TaxID=1309 RepID=UPI0002B50D44
LSKAIESNVVEFIKILLKFYNKFTSLHILNFHKITNKIGNDSKSLFYILTFNPFLHKTNST